MILTPSICSDAIGAFGCFPPAVTFLMTRFSGVNGVFHVFLVHKGSILEFSTTPLYKNRAYLQGAPKEAEKPRKDQPGRLGTQEKVPDLARYGDPMQTLFNVTNEWVGTSQKAQCLIKVQSFMATSDTPQRYSL